MGSSWNTPTCDDKFCSKVWLFVSRAVISSTLPITDEFLVMRRIVQSVGAGVGLATEAYAARKSSSAPNTAGTQQSDHANDSSLSTSHGGNEDDSRIAEDDEVDWDLDDAVDEHEGPRPEDKESGKTTMSVDHLVQIFIKQYPPPAEPGPYELPCPVILPQRRPRDKSRGFIRAYAPVLSDCGIDQAMFMQFLKAFHQASKVSTMIVTKHGEYWLAKLLLWVLLANAGLFIGITSVHSDQCRRKCGRKCTEYSRHGYFDIRDGGRRCCKRGAIKDKV